MGRLGQLLRNAGDPNNSEKLILFGVLYLITLYTTPSGLSNVFYRLVGTIDRKYMSDHGKNEASK